MFVAEVGTWRGMRNGDGEAPEAGITSRMGTVGMQGRLLMMS